MEIVQGKGIKAIQDKSGIHITADILHQAALCQATLVEEKVDNGMLYLVIERKSIGPVHGKDAGFEATTLTFEKSGNYTFDSVAIVSNHYSKGSKKRKVILAAHFWTSLKDIMSIIKLKKIKATKKKKLIDVNITIEFPIY